MFNLVVDPGPQHKAPKFQNIRGERNLLSKEMTTGSSWKGPSHQREQTMIKSLELSAAFPHSAEGLDMELMTYMCM